MRLESFTGKDRSGRVPACHGQGGQRATVDGADDKELFTDNLFANALGSMGAQFLIISCSVKGSDLSSMQVVQNLHETDGFRVCDGWELKFWECRLPIKQKKKQQSDPDTYKDIDCRRQYLVHGEKGTVITCQHREWMDTPWIAMWIDLVFKPHLDTNSTAEWGALLVWDNCGPHNTKAILDLFNEYCIHVKQLPLNMTDFLQVMDLIQG